MSGSIDAVDEHAAAGSIREKGLLPMDIHHSHETQQVARSQEAGSAFARYFVYPIWTGVNLKALAVFYRQMATLLAAGVSLSEALRSVGSRTRGKLGKIVAEAAKTWRTGGHFRKHFAEPTRIQFAADCPCSRGRNRRAIGNHDR